MKSKNSTLKAKIGINRNMFFVFFTIGTAQKEMVLDTRSKMRNAKLSEQKIINDRSEKHSIKYGSSNAKLSEQKIINDRIENHSIKYGSSNAKASNKPQNTMTHSLQSNSDFSFSIIDQLHCTIYIINNLNECKNAPIAVILDPIAFTVRAIEALFPSIERRNSSKSQTIYSYKTAFQSLNRSIYPLEVSIF